MPSIFMCSDTHQSTLPSRITQLESQTSDLQAEITRLLASLDEQQQEVSETQRTHTRKLDETERKLQAQVSLTISAVFDPVIDPIRTLQTAEIIFLKGKNAKMADYDEIKRELDIIKVYFALRHPLLYHA